jgi:Uma2 family endonuclease
MSNPLPRDRLMSIDEYFAFEEASPVRHEYVDGQVHAMTGVTRQHSRLTMNVAARLWAAARGGPCRVHAGEVKLRVGTKIYYPDVMVACGAEPRDTRIEDAPSVLVEVLSPSTERTDRGEKAMVYRGIPSLAAYIIIDQERRWVEHHRRGVDGHWQREVVTETGRVSVPQPSISLTLEEIYEGVEMPSPEEWLRRWRLREEAIAYG